MKPPAVPSRSRARIPPINEPPSPRPMVAYQGIGSGPGRESRARAPTTKPQTIRPMMKNNIGVRLAALPQLSADVQDSLENGQPGRHGEQVDRPLEQPPRCQHEPGRDHDDALGPRT